MFFETEVDRDEVYVQGELVYTRRLYYKENVDGTMPALEINSAIVETLQPQQRYNTTKARQRFFVLEEQYAIYPQSSGTLTIPEQIFSGSRRARGFFSRSEAVMTRSKEHVISVLPKPAAFTGHDWLPAKALEISRRPMGQQAPSRRRK